jgi:hypothetical protein
VGEDGSAGNAPGASPAAFTFVGVGGSTSMLCASCEVVASCDCAIAVSGVCCGTSSFFVSSPEGRGELALAPCIPRPVASVSCPGGLFSFSSSLAGARGVSTASSKAS